MRDSEHVGGTAWLGGTVTEDWQHARPAATAPTAGPTDADLLVRVARGDRDAFGMLYGRVGHKVFGVALRVLRDPSQAEEVAQEALLQVWRSAGRFDARRGSATSWILTITHRRAVDRVRSEQAHRARDGRAERGVWLPGFDSVSAEVEFEHERVEVRTALRTLTRVQREAIVLAYYGGRTYREVAEELGVPEGTVKSRLRDGLIRLREALGMEA